MELVANAIAAQYGPRVHECPIGTGTSLFPCAACEAWAEYDRLRHNTFGFAVPVPSYDSVVNSCEAVIQKYENKRPANRKRKLIMRGKYRLAKEIMEKFW